MRFVVWLMSQAAVDRGPTNRWPSCSKRSTSRRARALGGREGHIERKPDHGRRCGQHDRVVLAETMASAGAERGLGRRRARPDCHPKQMIAEMLPNGRTREVRALTMNDDVAGFVTPSTAPSSLPTATPWGERGRWLRRRECAVAQTGEHADRPGGSGRGRAPRRIDVEDLSVWFRIRSPRRPMWRSSALGGGATWTNGSTRAPRRLLRRSTGR